MGNKTNQRWLWYTVDHASNTVLAYTLGKRQDSALKHDLTHLVFKQAKWAFRNTA